MENKLWRRAYKRANRGWAAMNAFKHGARNICEDFAEDDDVLRKALPPKLTFEELMCFEEEIERAGLDMLEQEHAEGTKYYMTKRMV